MLPSHSKKERRTAAPGAPRDAAKVTRTPEALRRDKIGVMDEQMLRRVMARAHRGDVGAQALLRELVEADEPKRKLPVIRFDGLLEIVDPPDEQGEGGVREPHGDHYLKARLTLPLCEANADSPPPFSYVVGLATKDLGSRPTTQKVARNMAAARRALDRWWSQSVMAEEARSSQSHSAEGRDVVTIAGLRRFLRATDWQLTFSSCEERKPRLGSSTRTSTLTGRTDLPIGARSAARDGTLVHSRCYKSRQREEDRCERAGRCECFVCWWLAR